MLHYPLEWCERAGFDSILVLTLTEHHAAIQSFLRSHRIQKILYVNSEACSSLNDNLGTADVLRIAHKKGWLNSDFAVVPCDLVTTLDGSKLAELWMTTQAGFDADLGRRSRKYRSAGDGEDGRRGGMVVCYETMGEGVIKGQETDFLVTSPVGKPSSCSGLPDGDVGILLNSAPSHALKDISELPLRHGMIKKHPSLTLHSTLRDSGIYFLPHWVLKFIDRNPRLNSLREDVIPWLAKARWQNKRLAEKLGLLEILSAGGDTDSEDLPQEEYDVGSMSSTRKRRSSITADTPPIPPITTYFPSPSAPVFMRRVDTVHLYHFTCLSLAKSDPIQPSVIKIDPSCTLGEKAIVTGMDCLVADKVNIGAKAVVKKSVLGSGCVVGKGARLMGCVLMDGAVVGENVKLEGCTIGRKAVVGKKCVLKDCEVEDAFEVEDGTEAKNERFVAFSAEEEEDDEEDEEEAHSGDSDKGSDNSDNDNEEAASDEDDDTVKAHSDTEK
ncbi:hypothetical protein K440DRAFT_564484 [Wilcoxina mikolae CBS 423.85]|nr:hypothetical protein K440DRAFT_564484 [Wilcoxina mikolae CBS 423.85]